MGQHTEMAMDYLAQGKTLYGLDRFEEAIGYYKKAEAMDSSLRDVYLAEGEAFIMLDRFEEAKTAYQNILLLQKEDGEAYFHLGNVAFLQEDAAQGREWYAKAVNAGFSEPEMYMNLGYMFYEEGKLDEAIKQFNKALMLNKFQPQAWLYKAKAYLTLGKKPEAIQALDGMIQYTPEYFEGHHYRFLLSMQNGDREEAKQIVDRMLHLFPDDPSVWMDHLIYVETSGDAAAALEIYERHFAEFTDPDHLLEKAKILCGLPGREMEGLSLLKEIAEGGVSELAQSACQLTMIQYISQKDFSNALIWCEKLLHVPEQGMEYYNALYFMGFIHGKLGNTEEAKKSYEFAVAELRRASGKNPGLMDLYLLRCYALRGLGETQQALELVNYVLSVVPGMPEALYVRAEIYDDLHRGEEAAMDREKLGQAHGLLEMTLQTLK